MDTPSDADSGLGPSRGRSRMPRRRLRRGMGVAILLAALTSGGAQLAGGTWQGPTYRCLVDGPSSPLAEVSERSGIVTGSAAAWPLGRACEWAGADGADSGTTHSGSRSSTALTYAAGAAGLGVLTAARLPAGRRDARRLSA